MKLGLDLINYHRKTCSGCHYKIGLQPAFLEIRQYKGEKKYSSFWHARCYKLCEEYEKIEKDKPAWYDFLRENGVKINPKIFEL